MASPDVTTAPSSKELYNPSKQHQRRGVQFPWKLHQLLEDSERNGDATVISWLPDGKAFKVHNKQEFSKRVMPAYFNSSKHKTFQRSLNLWGFEKINTGPNKGACYHPFFIRGEPDLCHSMMRVKIKGNNNANDSTQSQDQQQQQHVSKFSEVVAAQREASAALAPPPSGRPAPTSTSSLLHYLTQPMGTSGLLPPRGAPFPAPRAERRACGVSEFIRNGKSAAGAASTTSSTTPKPPTTTELTTDAQLLRQLRMRNDALEAAIATTTSLYAPALPTTASLEADLFRSRLLTQGLGGGDSLSLLTQPRRRDPVYEAALAAAVASKIVQL